jgi:hypothetical protein
MRSAMKDMTDFLKTIKRAQDEALEARADTK